MKRGDELRIVPTSDQYYITASGHKLNNDQPSLPVLVLNVHSAAAQISSHSDQQSLRSAATQISSTSDQQAFVVSSKHAQSFTSDN